MRVLFIYPEHMRTRFKPIGISLLSNVIKARGHEPAFFDQSDCIFETPGDKTGVDLLLFKRFRYPEHLRMPAPSLTLEQAFRKAIDEFRPDVLAFSVTYLLFRNGLDLVRSLGPDRTIPTLFGGIHCTLNPGEVIAHPEVDMVCVGEGEEALPELLERMEQGGDITNIPNIWVKKDGVVHRNEPRPLRDSIDDLPLPDWSLFPDAHFYKPYMGKIYRAADLFTSRGCPNSCSYCFYEAYYRDAYKTKKHKVVFMSPERTMENIRFICERWGVELIKIRDADFTARPVEQIRELARLYEELPEAIRPKLLCNVYHHTVTKEKVDLMKRMNFVSVTMGLESGSEHIRKTYLNRRADNDRFFAACKYLRKAGIRLATGNMIGLPCETRANIFETIEANRKAGVDLADVSIMFPFPGTTINKTCRELGFLTKDLSQSEYYRAEPVMDMPQITNDELMGLMRTFQMYLHAPRWFYPFIRPAEKDTPGGRRYYRLLNRLFYHYIFHIKNPLRKHLRA